MKSSAIKDNVHNNAKSDSTFFMLRNSHSNTMGGGMAIGFCRTPVDEPLLVASLGG